MSYAPGAPADCRHKTIDDHSRIIADNQIGTSALVLAGTPVRKWTCSDCGRQGLWSKAWAYYGSLECKHCLRAAIDHVSCGCKPQKGRR